MHLHYLWGGCYLHVASRAAVLALTPCARRLWDDFDIFSLVVHLALSSRSDGTRVDGQCKCVSSRMVSQGSCCENEARVMRGHLSLGSPRTSKCRRFPATDCQLESALWSGRVEVRTGSVSSTGESVCLDGGIERAAPTLLRFKSCTVLDSLLVSLRGPSAAMCCRPRVRQDTSALVSSAKPDTAVPGGPGRQRRGL